MDWRQPKKLLATTMAMATAWGWTFSAVATPPTRQSGLSLGLEVEGLATLTATGETALLEKAEYRFPAMPDMPEPGAHLEIDQAFGAGASGGVRSAVVEVVTDPFSLADDAGTQKVFEAVLNARALMKSQLTGKVVSFSRKEWDAAEEKEIVNICKARVSIAPASGSPQTNVAVDVRRLVPSGDPKTIEQALDQTLFALCGPKGTTRLPLIVHGVNNIVAAIAESGPHELQKYTSDPASVDAQRFRLWMFGWLMKLQYNHRTTGPGLEKDRFGCLVKMTLGPESVGLPEEAGRELMDLLAGKDLMEPSDAEKSEEARAIFQRSAKPFLKTLLDIVVETVEMAGDDKKGPLAQLLEKPVELIRWAVDDTDKPLAGGRPLPVIEIVDGGSDVPTGLAVVVEARANDAGANVHVKEILETLKKTAWNPATLNETTNVTKLRALQKFLLEAAAVVPAKAK